MINFFAVMGVGLMVGRLTLNQLVGVRIPYPQQVDVAVIAPPLSVYRGLALLHFQ